MVIIIAFIFIILCQRLLELYIANRNRRIALSLGAKEYGADHYYLFFVLHISWILGWTIESYLNGWTLSTYWYNWSVLYLVVQLLRYWCIYSLGYCWNTRILVIPGCIRVRKGPYRFLKHPNYIVVAIEIMCVPLLCNAFITAIIASLCNALLLICIRIPQEEKAVSELLKSSLD